MCFIFLFLNLAEVAITISILLKAPKQEWNPGSREKCWKPSIENKVFERLINPENQSINIEPRQGYGIKERKALEKAIDRLNQLAE